MKKVSSQAQNGAVKKKRSFNFIDVILILIAVVVVLTAINIISPMSFLNDLRSDSQHTIQYTVEITGVDEAYIEKIKENDVVVDANSKYSLGSVTAVDYNTQYSELEYDEDSGAGVMAVYPEKYNVLITITAQGSYSEGSGYSVNDHRIAIGEKMTLRFPNYVGEGYCISLSVA